MLAHPESYDSTTKMPGMILLAYYCGAVPAIAWLLVPVLVLYMSLEGRKAVQRSSVVVKVRDECMPRSRLWYCIDAGFGSGVGSCFVLATVFNGVGQTEYPVVFIQYGDVVERTVLVQLGYLPSLKLCCR